MHKAICYVSTVSPGLSQDEIEQILLLSQLKNNNAHINGLLLFSNGSFLQIIEGESSIIDNLWKNINYDRRHFNLIKIFEQDVVQENFEDYHSDFVSINTRYSPVKFQEYLNHIQMLDFSSQTAIKNILNSFVKLN
ncbi:BLUF domain-containing protein [Mesonia maritima]|uniref:BLUF domain-containing protein n=1 Tax=Mesonia maritima TaxID=1793873 RepID=A0ABU1KC60_9FLAO|nr:BLUF domain-containing protein [Mesonia maritima]MDR6302042.1 hypothetical protein [Mesonia maritima]